MGEIVLFCVGCRKCANLVQVGKKSYTCSSRVHMDDTPVMPIVDGQLTDDWNICEGTDYKRLSNVHSRTS